MDGVGWRSLASEKLDWRFKALPAAADGLTAAQWLAGRPRATDLNTPAALLDGDALDHNLAAMDRWRREAGVEHAPHGKTTMAPQLWRRQLEAGAAAITLATPAQLRVARAFGTPRVVLANELLDPAALRWASEWVAAGARLTTFVDSPDAVDAMDAALRGAPAPLEVCVEVGAPGGRAGARDAEQARATAEAARRAEGLVLAGVAGYEGAAVHEVDPDSLREVDAFLNRMRRLFSSLDFDIDRPILSAGGSQYPDQAVAELGSAAAEGAEVLLRAGSYVIHDDGLYSRVTPSARGRSGPRLQPALRVRTQVLSRPEPDLAVLDAGRRDLSFDAGMPTPVGRPGTSVTELNDQHAILRGRLEDVRVGDRISLGISHPCTALDKWSLLPVVDGEGVVVDLVRTYF